MNLNRQTNRWCPLVHGIRLCSAKPKKAKPHSRLGFLRLYETVSYFFGGSRHFSAGTRRCFSRWTVSCRSKAYSTLHRGINTSIPRMPMRLPPTVTAASTQMEGSPTEEPTTWG